MTSALRHTTAARGIPAMRPSYDGEHPVAPTPTPIYDELYSEYRRLFRALPGDRAGEEDLRFTGFAVRERRYGDDYRDPYATRVPYSHEQLSSFGRHQPFPGYPGLPAGQTQFVPAQQQVAQHQSQQQAAPQPHPQAVHPTDQPAGQQPGGAFQQPAAYPPGPYAAGAGRPAPGYSRPQQGHPQQGYPQGAVGGQGWVATGYLAPATVPAPAVPQPVTVPAPAGPAAGRHRNAMMLSLPPGRGAGLG
ncbi:hypothetical protein ACIGXM_24815 [Kitasatospora sp. NPDC052896]|uniref:hypothetical protein n=1 Tax=Kitasatospora sp. NPDC052896 TaxID=3364061 RepID=UPI0037C77F86